MSDITSVPENYGFERLVYVVVTEEWYGGKEKVKVFFDDKDAKKYCETLTDVDAIVLEKVYREY